MLSRALSLAAVMLLIGGFKADPAQAQVTNLEAGKSPSQIFAGTCSACHKSPRGLLKSISPGSLPGFLRQHYTTSSEMAGPLSAFLISNGAADTRGGAQTKQGKDAPKPEPRQAARPDVDGVSPQGEPGRQDRNAKRLPRPGEGPEGTKPLAEGERGPDGRKTKLGKRGKPGSEEPPKADTATGEPSTNEPAKDDKPKGETAKDEGKPEGDKPSGEAKVEPTKPEPAPSDTTKSDAPKAPGGGEAPSLRADPVPAVTPAPKSAEGETRPLQTATPAPSAAPVGPAPEATAEPAPPPPAVTASAPPTVPPAGPPAPPISQ
jgi:hypothetical protein